MQLVSAAVRLVVGDNRVEDTFFGLLDGWQSLQGWILLAVAVGWKSVQDFDEKGHCYSLLCTFCGQVRTRLL